jgi:hypothetical protein
MAAGAHSVEITADGYKPQKRELMIAAGVPLVLKFALEAIPRTGKVRISSSLPGAAVSIDGHWAGTAPLELELDPGGHSVEVSASGYVARRDELVVAAGQTRDIAVTLDKVRKPEPPKDQWYRKWYIWSAVGIVVAGSTAVAINYGTTEAPVAGTLSPGAGAVH